MQNLRLHRDLLSGLEYFFLRERFISHLLPRMCLDECSGFSTVADSPENKDENTEGVLETLVMYFWLPAAFL